jgi:hypothetical protein
MKIIYNIDILLKMLDVEISQLIFDLVINI